MTYWGSTSIKANSGNIISTYAHGALIVLSRVCLWSVEDPLHFQRPCGLSGSVWETGSGWDDFWVSSNPNLLPKCVRSKRQVCPPCLVLLKCCLLRERSAKATNVFRPSQDWDPVRRVIANTHIRIHLASLNVRCLAAKQRQSHKPPVMPCCVPFRARQPIQLPNPPECQSHPSLANTLRPSQPPLSACSAPCVVWRGGRSRRDRFSTPPSGTIALHNIFVGSRGHWMDIGPSWRFSFIGVRVRTTTYQCMYVHTARRCAVNKTNSHTKCRPPNHVPRIAPSSHMNHIHPLPSTWHYLASEGSA